jgi:hypothetical protein
VSYWYARIWGVGYSTQVELRETPEGLELTADVGDEETTIVLDLEGVKRLRLALSRYERLTAAGLGVDEEKSCHDTR